MASFEEYRYPQFRSVPTHFTKNVTYFLPESIKPLAPKSYYINSGITNIQINVLITVLEEAVGYKCEWCKVKYLDRIGHIPMEDLKMLPDITKKGSLPFNNSFEYNPSILAIDIDWKKQPRNEVYYDKKLGKYCINFDTGVERVYGPDLISHMKDALYRGTELILKETGRVYTQEIISDLIENYFEFSVAEEFTFNLDRPCTTMRAFVNVPAKYIHSGFIPENQVSVIAPELDIGANINLSDQYDPTAVGDTGTGQGSDSGGTQTTDYGDPFIYNNYAEFDAHIQKIIYLLGLNEPIRVANKWRIQPSGVEINLTADAIQVAAFRETVKNFLDSNGILEATWFGALDLKDKGKIKFFIDRTNLELKAIKYELTIDGKVINKPLNINSTKFYKDVTIKNASVIKYIRDINADGSILENIRDSVKDTGGNIIKTADALGFDEALNFLATPVTALGVGATNAYNAGVSFLDTQLPDNATTGPIPIGELVSEYANSVNAATEELNNTFRDINDYGKRFDENLTKISEALDSLNPINSYKEFILKYHEPQVSSIEALPLDLADCLVDNANRVDYFINTKTKQFVDDFNKYKKFRQEQEDYYKKNGWGKFLSKSIWDDVNYFETRELKLMLGTIKPTKNDKELNTLQKVNAVIGPFIGSIDWQRILAESLKCSSTTLNPLDYAALLNTYQEIRKQLERLASVTVCNPYLTKLLKDLNAFKLPKFKVKNRNQELIDQLKQLLIQFVNDVIVLGIRQLLNNSIKDCLKDKNPSFNNKPDLFANGLGEASNDPAIEDLLDSLFGTKDKNGKTNDEAKSAALDALNEVMNDILPCISNFELCSLLVGNPVNSEVYDVIISIIEKRGYSIKIGNKTILLKDVFSDQQSIGNLFSTIGSAIDTSECEEILRNTPSNKSFICDDGTIKKLRCDIANNTGLTPDQVALLLDDVRDQELQNVADVLDFLNKPNAFPFGLEDIPTVLCKNGIPPLVNLSPRIESFKAVTSNLLSDIYDTFDEESVNWYRTTYSTAGSVDKSKLIKLDEATGLIKPMDVNASSLPDPLSTDPEAQRQAQNNVSGSFTYLPSYLFKESLKNDEIKYNYSSQNTNFSLQYNGKVQQDLDLNIISEDSRKLVANAEIALTDFLGVFMRQITIYGTSATLNTFFGDDKLIVKGDNVLNSIVKSIGAIANSDFVNFLKTCDAFTKNSTAAINNPTLTMFPNTNASVANALLFANEGAPTLVGIMEYIIKNKSTLNTLIQKASDVDLEGLNGLIKNMGVSLDFTYTSEPSDAFKNTFGGESSNSVEGLLKGKLDNALAAYEQVKGFYKTVSNAKIMYPNFTTNLDINLKNINISSNIIPNVVKNTSTNKDVLYDYFILEVYKNEKIFIKNRGSQPVREDIYAFISESLKVTDVSKQSVLSALFSKYNDTYVADTDDKEYSKGDELPSYLTIDNQYNFIQKLCFKNIKNNLLKDDNLFLNLHAQPVGPADSAGETKYLFSPYTQRLKLVLQQPPHYKQCGFRKHYLDIDDIKNDIFNAREQSYCGLEQMADDRLLNNKTINSKELSEIQTNETQNILQYGFYRLAIRTFLHDILLRGIGIFGVYDPQSLKDDNLFLEFMSDSVESEMRGLDNNFFDLLTKFLVKDFIFKTKTSMAQNKYSFMKKFLFKTAVREELKNYVLPKLAKRIDVDTYKEIKNETSKELKLINVLDNVIYDINFSKNIIKFVNDSVYFRQSDTVFKKIFVGSTSDLEKLKKEFRASMEFKVLFNYVFPLSKYLSFYFIINTLSTSSRKQIIDAFKKTKKTIINTTKLVITNGEAIEADTDNIQDLLNEDNTDFWTKFLLEALLLTPIKIFKSFVEGSEPAITLSSSIYKVSKMFIPETPSFIIPAISWPIGYIPPLGFGLIPFTNPIVSTIYLLTGLWYEGPDDLLTKTKKFIDEKSLNYKPDVCPEEEKGLLEDKAGVYYLLNNGKKPFPIDDNEKAAVYEENDVSKEDITTN